MEYLENKFLKLSLPTPPSPSSFSPLLKIVELSMRRGIINIDDMRKFLKKTFVPQAKNLTLSRKRGQKNGRLVKKFRGRQLELHAPGRSTL